MQSIGDVLTPDEANVRTMIFSPRSPQKVFVLGKVHFFQRCVKVRRVIKEEAICGYQKLEGCHHQSKVSEFPRKLCLILKHIFVLFQGFVWGDNFSLI